MTVRKIGVVLITIGVLLFSGTAVAQLEDLMSQLQAEQNYYMQWMDQAMQQNEAQLRMYEQYFIDYYRQNTGDYTSPDNVAYQKGMALHCQQYPLDCQLAIQGSQQAMADQQAANAAHNASVQEQSAANDASFNAWMQGQADQQKAHENYMDGAIRGVGDYSDPSTGTTYTLPYAPSQGTWYQTPDGLPLVFDSGSNIWYQIDANGMYTPYYGVP